MEKLSYKIANHILTLSGSGITAAMAQIYGFDAFLTDTPEKEWEIRFEKKRSAPVFRTFSKFNFGDINCSFGKTDGSRYVFSMQSRESECPELQMEYTAGENTMHAYGFGDSSMLRFALWSAFNLFAIPCNMFAIHSSVIVYDNKANLFLGESGTGKSTHTRLWLKNFPQAQLLNDDSPIVAVENGRFMAYGSPWSGKTHCYHNAGFPINAFVRLKQAPQNTIARLNRIQSFIALQPSCPPAMSKDSFYSEKIIGILDLAIRQIPVYGLSCLPDDDAAILANSTLYNI